MDLPDWFDLIKIPVSSPEKTPFISSPSYFETRIFIIPFRGRNLPVSLTIEYKIHHSGFKALLFDSIEMKSSLTGVQNIGKTIYEYRFMSRFLPDLTKYFKNLPFSEDIANNSFKSYLEKYANTLIFDWLDDKPPIYNLVLEDSLIGHPLLIFDSSDFVFNCLYELIFI